MTRRVNYSDDNDVCLRLTVRNMSCMADSYWLCPLLIQIMAAKWSPHSGRCGRFAGISDHLPSRVCRKSAKPWGGYPSYWLQGPRGVLWGDNRANSLPWGALSPPSRSFEQLRLLCPPFHWWPVNSPQKWPATRKMLPFEDVIMIRAWSLGICD